MLAHRGPDANGVKVLTGERSAVLGAVRLRIIDLSTTADQPLSNEDETVWVAFNGELYNCHELREMLVAAGHRFQSSSDTECLVHLYEECQNDVERMLHLLRGMFAFAIWDHSRERLFLARDRLGIKPAYWCESEGGIAFASEARALVHAGLAASTPNLVGIGEFLAWGSIPGDMSIFAGIEKVPPGHYVVWDGGAPRVREWWRPRQGVADGLLDPGEAEERLRFALHDSMRRHVIAERTIGVFLSGGIDSTAVATLASQYGVQRGLTVTFPEAPEMSEGSAASETAARLGIQHDEIAVTSEGIADCLWGTLANTDQPTVDALNSWLVCRAARDAGLVVALSGLGGDELFGGYPSFGMASRVRSIVKALGYLPADVRRVTRQTVAGRGPGSRLVRLLEAPSSPEGAYGAIRRLFADSDLRRLGLPAARPVPPQQKVALGEAFTLLELSRFMANQLLADTDSVSMAHSLEVRVPLIDDLVISESLSIPGSVRLVAQKAMLAAACEIPSGATKRPFAMPFERWMRGPLQAVIREAVCSNDLPLGEMLPYRARQSVWDAFESGRTSWSRPWALAMLRLWPTQNGLRW